MPYSSIKPTDYPNLKDKTLAALEEGIVSGEPLALLIGADLYEGAHGHVEQDFLSTLECLKRGFRIKDPLCTLRYWGFLQDYGINSGSVKQKTLNKAYKKARELADGDNVYALGLIADMSRYAENKESLATQELYKRAINAGCVRSMYYADPNNINLNLGPDPTRTSPGFVFIPPGAPVIPGRSALHPTPPPKTFSIASVVANAVSSRTISPMLGGSIKITKSTLLALPQPAERTGNEYLEQAAALGFAPAQRELGIRLFQSGQRNEGIEYLGIAAAQGEILAQINFTLNQIAGELIKDEKAMGYANLAGLLNLAVVETFFPANYSTTLERIRTTFSKEKGFSIDHSDGKNWLVFADGSSADFEALRVLMEPLGINLYESPTLPPPLSLEIDNKGPET